MNPAIVHPGEGQAFHAPAGALVEILDLEGAQAAELVAFVEQDPAEYLDCAVTMEVVGRLFPTEKSKFYTNRYEPLLTLVEDQVGCHDLIHPASSLMTRSLFLGEGGERQGTLEWLQEAAREAGLVDCHLPRPVHLFRRTDVDEEGNFVLMTTPSEAGQGVKLQVERPAILLLAVSDDEISPITGCHPTPIQITLQGGD